MRKTPKPIARTTATVWFCVVDLARETDAALIPFLLAGVAGVAELNQPDGIHPNAEGARIVADNVWRVLEGVLQEPVGRS